MSTNMSINMSTNMSIDDVTDDVHYTQYDGEITCSDTNDSAAASSDTTEHINTTEDEYAAKVQELALLGMKLGVPVPYATYSVDVIKDGAVIDHREGYSRSWNRNFYNWLISEVCYRNLYSTSFGAGLLSMKATDGTLYGTGYIAMFYSTSSAYNPETDTGYSGSVNSSVRGIVVGTGVGPEMFNDYALGVIINSGINSGQLSYQESAYPTKTWNSGNSQFAISWKRYFNNNSGASITVSEIGIYGRFDRTPYYYMVCRDKISSIDVVDASQLCVTYNIITQFPINRS